MKEIPNIKLTEVGVYFESADILAVADFHLGKHDNIQHRSYPEPRDSHVETKFKETVSKYSPNIVIFNGDTFHHTVPTEESQQTIHRIIQSGNFKSIFTVGNHEEKKKNISEFISENIIVKDEHIDTTSERKVFTHGHKYPTKTGNLYIIGHLHPSVEQNGKVNSCYIKAKTNKGHIIVLPSPNPAVNPRPITNQSPSQVCPILSIATKYEYAFPGENTFKQVNSS